jgi:hypothetical protein
MDWFVSLCVMIAAMLVISALYPKVPVLRKRSQERDVLAEQRSSRARYVALEHEAMAHWEKLCNCPGPRDARMRACDSAWGAGDPLPSYCLSFDDWLDSQYSRYHVDPAKEELRQYKAMLEFEHAHGRARDTRPHA